MKTADLIPLILFELDECDEYGFELTKNIETKSNGKIVIKQPTLYTLLKKLEKSKFISSYWQDSDIGGKRHYYKITDNGKLQLSTLPSYIQLIKSICEEDDSSMSFSITDQSENESNTISSTDETTNTLNTPQSDVYKEKEISIMDALLEDNSPATTILPTDEVFNENNVDNITEIELNTTNSDILKEENTLHNEKFAENENVTKFTEKTNISEEYKSKFNNISFDASIDNIEYNTTVNNQPIQYVEYVDFKKSAEYVKSKQTTKKLILKSFITSLYLLIMLSISYFVCQKFGTTPFYYVSIITGVTAIIFYPLVCISNYNKLRLRFQEIEFQPRMKKRIFIALTLFILMLIAIIIINISMGINTVSSVLAVSNFANFYTPLILSSAILVDNLLIPILIKKN